MGARYLERLVAGLIRSPAHARVLLPGVTSELMTANWERLAEVVEEPRRSFRGHYGLCKVVVVLSEPDK